MKLGPARAITPGAAGVVCGDCGAPMRLIHPKPTEANKGWKRRAFWGCTQYPGCRGTHGAHQESGLPLGTPANEATRRARMQAHEEFDQLWKTPGWFTRNAAYAWITEAMGQTAQIHIGSATIEECGEICRLARAKAVEMAEQKRGVEVRLKKEKKYRPGRRASFEQAERTASKLDRKAERRHQSEPPQRPAPEPEEEPPRSWWRRDAALEVLATQEAGGFTLAEGVAFPDEDDELGLEDWNGCSGAGLGGTRFSYSRKARTDEI